MKAISSNLDRLRIATPCPISWEQMTGNDSVRFCDHCQLNVYNISELSKSEAELLIASTEGRLCGRIYRRADGTVLTKDCPVGLRALRKRVATRVAAVFATLVSISAAAFGQEPAAKKEKSACVQQTKITRTPATPGHAETAISGAIRDTNGAAIPGAKVSITKSGSNGVSTAITTSEGQFKFESLGEGNYSFKIEAVSFKNLVVTDVVLEKNQLLNLDMLLEVSGDSATVGIIVWDGDSAIDTSKSSVTFTLSDRLFRKLPLPK